MTSFLSSSFGSKSVRSIMNRHTPSLPCLASSHWDSSGMGIPSLLRTCGTETDLHPSFPTRKHSPCWYFLRCSRTPWPKGFLERVHMRLGTARGLGRAGYDWNDTKEMRMIQVTKIEINDKNDRHDENGGQDKNDKKQQMIIRMVKTWKGRQECQEWLEWQESQEW